MRFRHNVMNVDSILAFEGIRGGINQNCKDVYFIRLTGVNDTLAADVVRMDADMKARMADGRTAYRRISSLPRLNGLEAADYEKFYQAFAAGNREAAGTKILKTHTEYQKLLAEGVRKVLELFFANQAFNASIEKSFVVKLLFWHDYLLSGIRTQWDCRQSVKLVMSDIIKKQEYLFAYLLTLLGCDVLLLQSGADISKEEEKLGLSEKIELGSFGQVSLPEYTQESAASSPVTAKKPATVNPVIVKKPAAVSPVTARKPAAASPVIVKKPAAANPVTSRKPAAASPVIVKKPAAANPVTAKKPTAVNPVTVKKQGARTEKTFEELALLASSVVLIGIHDKKGNMIGSGSGIMIGRDGYILTNSHVASGGVFYSVRIEEDETVYSTDELIKYHSVLDLAVLRIDRTLNPLPLYRGQNRLVRGQKVVAIGSPLGLFNSVSDGIISGFRKIDGVDMIQFTAPTSHGSSGGALLNMYGEVIGISTAGFDNAQNINLAVGYESILPFIRGFF